MKFVCNKSNILDAIQTAQKGVTGKSTIAILQGILILANSNEIILIGSDRDISIETKFDAEIYEKGSIVVDSKLFGDIIRKLPNSEIELETHEDNTLEIRCNKSTFNLIYMNSDDFPNLPSVNEDINVEINQQILKNMIKGTLFAVAQEETRPILTGVLFEIKNNKLSLVALDGYRLALRSESINVNNNFSVVIPGKTLNEVSKILEDGDDTVKISFTKNHILFNLNKTRIISILLSGEFINYKSIIPEEYNLKVIANRIDILNCIERASLLAKDGNTNLIKFDINEENMIITSNSQLGKVREELNIILQGQSIQIAFNSKYLIDLLKIMDEEEIVLEFSSAVSPCIVKNKESDNSIYLVLPVRIFAN
ncbi:MAG: DNA polymerase III subunit beta [Clostridiaceae bacterium]